MDDIRLNSKDVHNENPAEKANFHGVLNDTSNPYKGKNYVRLPLFTNPQHPGPSRGFRRPKKACLRCIELREPSIPINEISQGYPSCVAAWDTGLLGVSTLSVGSLFSPDGVPEGQRSRIAPAGAHPFPSHTAPLDIKWTPDGLSAYVSFHGSWDRSPADGYRVMKVEFGKDGQPVQPLNSKSAGTLVMENQNTGSCSSEAASGPSGLDFDSKKRLFVSSDSTGEIYVLYGA